MKILISKDALPEEENVIPIRDFESAIRAFEYLVPSHVIFGWIDGKEGNTYDLAKWLSKNSDIVRKFEYEIDFYNNYTSYFEDELRKIKFRD